METIKKYEMVKWYLIVLGQWRVYVLLRLILFAVYDKNFSIKSKLYKLKSIF